MKMNKLVGLSLAMMLGFGVVGCVNEGIEEEQVQQVQQEEQVQQYQEEEQVEQEEPKEENNVDYYYYEEEQQEYMEEKEEVTIGMRNALASAESYLDYMGFSKEGLRDQLEYEGYLSEEINYALENVVVDWNEECVESAKSYLDYMSFSREGLIDQLEYEGFSSEQINYAMERVWK